MSENQRCLHGFEVVIKFDGGRGAVLCGECRVIVGYLSPDQRSALLASAKERGL